MNLRECLFLTVVASACDFALAEPVPTYDSAAMLREADLVFVGTVLEGVERASREKPTVVVRVDRVLKQRHAGSVGDPVSISFRPGSTGRLSGGNHGLFVLRCENSPSNCAPVNPWQPAWQALEQVSSFSQTSRQDEAGVERAVTEELVATLAASDSQLASSSGRGLLSIGEAESLREDVTRALTTLPREGVLDAIHGQGRPSNLPVRLGLAGAQVRLGDFQGLEDLSPAMTGADVDLQAARDYVAWGMAEFDDPTKALVGPMSDWLGAKDVVVRRNAAMTLRKIATPEVVKPLVRRGLVDPDQTIRYYAVTGLAAATHEGEYPSFDKYRAAEAKYLAFWTARKAGLESAGR